MTDLDMKSLKVKRHYEDGWSFNVSMAKAGFTSNWMYMVDVINHPIIKALREEQQRKTLKKRANQSPMSIMARQASKT